MHPIVAHHAGEDSLVNLLLLGGTWLSVAVAVAVAVGRARLVAARNRITRLLRRERE